MPRRRDIEKKGSFESLGNSSGRVFILKTWQRVVDWTLVRYCESWRRPVSFHAALIPNENNFEMGSHKPVISQDVVDLQNKNNMQLVRTDAVAIAKLIYFVLFLLNFGYSTCRNAWGKVFFFSKLAITLEKNIFGKTIKKVVWHRWPDEWKKLWIQRNGKVEFVIYISL